MKNKSLQIILFLLAFGSVFGQIDTAKFLIAEITYDAGVFFPRNENFQNSYNTKSNFNWSIGTVVGQSNHLFNIWGKYSQYGSEFDSLKADGTFSSIVAKRNQLSIGFINPISLSNKTYIQLKSGISYNFIYEDLSKLYSEQIGFLFSVGYMKRLPFISYYFDFGYDYTRVVQGKYFSDWSGVLISTGLSFHLVSQE